MTHLFLALAFMMGLGAEPPKLKDSKAVPVGTDLKEDALATELIEPYKKQVQQTFDQELVEAPKGLSRFGDENFLGYWVADEMRAFAAKAIGKPVRFAITNSGGLRSELPSGKLKVANIYELMPFENGLIVVESTGAEVIQMVKESLNRGRRGGEPCSGVLVQVTGQPSEYEFKITWDDGSHIDPKEVVHVATSDYLYSGGDTIPTLVRARKPIDMSVQLRQILLDSCKALGLAGKKLMPPAKGRIQVASAIQSALKEKKFKFK